MSLPPPKCPKCLADLVFIPGGPKWRCLQKSCLPPPPLPPPSPLSPKQRDALHQVLVMVLEGMRDSIPKCQCCGAIPRVYVMSDAISMVTEWCCPTRAAELRKVSPRLYATGPIPHLVALWEMVDLL